MRYTQTCEVTLAVPLVLLDAATRALTDTLVGYGPVPRLDFDEALILVLGQEGNITLHEHDFEAPDGYAIYSGGTWGGRTGEDNAALAALAALGVTGVVDAIGEDNEMWRWRLAGGKLAQYGGEVIYRSDPGEPGVVAR